MGADSRTLLVAGTSVVGTFVAGISLELFGIDQILGDHASARICRIANKAVGHSRGAIFRQKRLDSGRAVE
jgi:hypothetical protein